MVGTWRLKIDPTGWQIYDPKGSRNYIDVAYLNGHRLQSRGGIWTSPNLRLGGNGWCEEPSVPVTYSWSAEESALTLTLLGADRCGTPKALEHFVWAGAWNRG
jgi:hypothetical protein